MRIADYTIEREESPTVRRPIVITERLPFSEHIATYTLDHQTPDSIEITLENSVFKSLGPVGASMSIEVAIALRDAIDALIVEKVERAPGWRGGSL